MSRRAAERNKTQADVAEVGMWEAMQDWALVQLWES